MKEDMHLSFDLAKFTCPIIEGIRYDFILTKMVVIFPELDEKSVR